MTEETKRMGTSTETDERHDAPLSRLDIEQMAERGAMAAEVTLPGEKFRALVAVALSDMGTIRDAALEARLTRCWLRA